MNYTREDLIDAVTVAIDYLKTGGDGCYTFALDDRLAVCVGWSAGYDPTDETCIHAISDPTYCLNAGIKVWTSDDMRTDYDLINAPYSDNGDVYNSDVSVSPEEDIEHLVDYLLGEYSTFDHCNLAKDGRLIDCITPYNK